MAEPCVTTSAPPSSTIISKIGKSQNFFLTRRNIHNSARKDMQLPTFFKIGSSSSCQPSRRALPNSLPRLVAFSAPAGLSSSA